MDKIEHGYCFCGCGNQTNLVTHTDKRRGYVMGEPMKFIRGHQIRLRTGKDSPSYGVRRFGKDTANWKGGRAIEKKKYTSYMRIKFPLHSRSHSDGYVYEHILVVEKALGFQIGKDAVVHHVDGNGLNNDLSNLMVFRNQAEHSRFHRLHFHREVLI